MDCLLALDTTVRGTLLPESIGGPASVVLAALLASPTCLQDTAAHNCFSSRVTEDGGNSSYFPSDNSCLGSFSGRGHQLSKHCLLRTRKAQHLVAVAIFMRASISELQTEPSGLPI